MIDLPCPETLLVQGSVSSVMAVAIETIAQNYLLFQWMTLSRPTQETNLENIESHG